jgi:hypothetical protein
VARHRDSGTVVGQDQDLEVKLTTTASVLGGPTRPALVVLADRWESTTEPGWITRQVAGALACIADVHVVATGDSAATATSDSVFTVYRSGPGLAADMAATVCDRVQAHGLVVAGDGWREMADALDRVAPDLPATVLTLSPDGRFDEPDLVTRVADRSRAVMVVTEEARDRVPDLAARRDLVQTIGAPMAANPSALCEPDPMVAGSEYVLVHTNVPEGASHYDADTARMLRLRYPGTTIAVLHSDAFCVWHRSSVERAGPIERSSDLDRLMAWALMTVDLQPGPLFARQCITSLLYGTPIVVPHDSRGRPHAERGGGGLWFANPTELSWCVEAIFDPQIRSTLGTQGRAYADKEFGSTDAFIERVTEACGPELRAAAATTT